MEHGSNGKISEEQDLEISPKTYVGETPPLDQNGTILPTENSNNIVDEQAPSEDCTHHWMLGSPSGGISSGQCKHCGNERSFDEDKAVVFHNPRVHVPPDTVTEKSLARLKRMKKGKKEN